MFCDVIIHYGPIIVHSLTWSGDLYVSEKAMPAGALDSVMDTQTGLVNALMLD